MPISSVPNLLNRLLVLFAVGIFAAAPLRACTMFVLTDGERTLFCNNEDWFNRNTRLWFVPAGDGHLGCAFVGFDDGWAQGGVNSAGLAFDWWASGKVDYTPDPALRPVRGNPAERMLESCSTVEDAIQFFRTYREPSFATARIFVADRTGASVVVYARDGNVHFDQLHRNRGIGYGRAALDRELRKMPPPTPEKAANILQACLQPGEGGTKYSNVFDLRAGTILIYPSLSNPPIELSLAAELAKGGHYYDIPKLNEQLGNALQPLLPAMQRFYLDQFQPLANQDAAVVERLRAIIRDAAAGKMKPADYTPELWAELSKQRKEIQADMQRLGSLRALALVESKETGGTRSFRCLADFEKARVLGRYDLDAHNRVALIRPEFAEKK